MIGTIKTFAAAHALRILAVFLGLVALFAAIQTVRIEGVWCSDAGPEEKPRCIMRGFRQEVQVYRITLSEVAASRDAEIAKHKATKQAYIEAQEEAARLEAERLARVVARQERINDEVKADFQQRIAALRARADSLRAQIAAAAAGSGAAGASGDVAVPGTSDSASGAHAAPDCQRFPAQDALTDLECRRIATEQATQLEALIGWVSRQMQVEQ